LKNLCIDEQESYKWFFKKWQYVVINL